VENTVFNLYAKFNGDWLWNEKPLVLWKFDNNNANKHKNKNKNIFDSAWGMGNHFWVQRKSSSAGDSMSYVLECLWKMLLCMAKLYFSAGDWCLQKCEKFLLQQSWVSYITGSITGAATMTMACYCHKCLTANAIGHNIKHCLHTPACWKEQKIC